MGTDAPGRSPWLAGLLSALAPGAGQLYNGERAKGWAMLCIAGGILLASAATHAWLTGLLLGAVYLCVMIPSASDAYRTAGGQAAPVQPQATWYVVLMLLSVGPFALPLLWQHPRFSRGAKIGWTIAVILMALAAVLALSSVGTTLEQLAPSLSAFQ